MQQSRSYFHLPLFSMGLGKSSISRIKDSIEKMPDRETRRVMSIHLEAATDTWGGTARRIYSELCNKLMYPNDFEDSKSTFAGNMHLAYMNYRLLGEGLYKAQYLYPAAECFLEAGRTLAVVKDFYNDYNRIYQEVYRMYGKAVNLFASSGGQLESVETRLELIQLYLKFFTHSRIILFKPHVFNENVPFHRDFNERKLLEQWIFSTLDELGALRAEGLRRLKADIFGHILPSLMKEAQESRYEFIIKAFDYFKCALDKNYPEWEKKAK